MQYTYKFVNGESISVEVSEEMLAVLQDEDRLESNNEQTNSKRPGRFVRLDASGPDGKPMEIADPKTLDPTEGEKRLEAAISQLSHSQRLLVQAIYFEGISIVEYARRKGVFSRQYRRDQIPFGKNFGDTLHLTPSRDL